MSSTDTMVYTLISHFGVAVVLENTEGEQTTVNVPRNSGYVVGDHVILKGHRLQRVPRENELARKTPFSPRQVMAANLKSLGIVISPVPKVPTHFIDATIVSARLSGITPFIIVNKMDFAEGDTLLKETKTIFGDGVSIFGVSAKTSLGIAELTQHIADSGRTLFVGMSGAGKSSLTNAILPHAQQAIGAVVVEGEHGKHKTSASMLLKLPQGGELIDTPGIRDFKPVDIQKSELAHYFVGFEKALEEGCRFRNCLHDHEPGCAVLEAVQAGTISKTRYTIYHELLQECV